MTEPLASLALSLLAGIAVGAFFFGGLWWTTQKILAPGQPALWFLGSLLVRMGVTLAVFYGVAQGDWRRLLVCLLGFFVARSIVIRLTRDTTPQSGNRAR